MNEVLESTSSTFALDTPQTFRNRLDDQMERIAGRRTETRNTKIVCTLGPACDSVEGIRQLLEGGASVFRFNFSHGNHASHTDALHRLRAEAERMDKPISVMQDLCGPKIRLSYVAVDQLQAVEGQSLRITTAKRLPQIDTEVELATTYEPLLDDLNPGDHVLINDGRVELIVIDKSPEYAVTRVVRPGVISVGKGLNMPGVTLSTPSVTEKDWADLEWAIEHDVEYVALSFVRHPEDLLQIHQVLDQRDCRARVIAKIERPEALENIHAIIKHSDALMVARGDLGLETDFADVPLLQKKLIELCRHHAKPVITATQMLDSMVTSSTPTRAEVSDVANAILDGSDAIMLSNETAAGQFPQQAVQVLDRIARSSEAGATIMGSRNWSHDRSDAAALTEAAARIAVRNHVRRIVVYTRSGHTARLMSRYRLPIPIVAVTSCEVTCRQLSLSYGVQPLWLPEIQSLSQLLTKMNRLAIDLGWGDRGDQLVVVSSLDDQQDQVDTLHVHRVAEPND